MIGRGAPVREIETLWETGVVASKTEAELLDRFANRRDEEAFAVLVRRHGPSVLSECRRVLRDEHAAEDAFQATFLVLARKAGTITAPERLGGWLVGVARRTAKKSRLSQARRSRHERAAVTAIAQNTSEPISEDWKPILAEEIGRLPDEYRAPVVLCHMEGRSTDEAAKALGWPRGTVGTRLSRARALLRFRLTRRGVTPAAIPVAFALIQSTTKAATKAGAASAEVTKLASEVIHAMMFKKIAVCATALLFVSLAGGGAYLARANAERSPVQESQAPARSEADSIPKGAYVVTRVTLNGNPSRIGDEMKREIWSFVNNIVLIQKKTTEVGFRETKGTISFKPRKDNPDTFHLEADPATKGVRARIVDGIYKLGDDSLKLAWIDKGDGPPTDFDSRPESPATMVILELVPLSKAPKVEPAEEAAEEERLAPGEATYQLRQIALGMVNHINPTGHFPASCTRSEDGKPLLSWRVAILPFMDQQELYDQFHQDEPWDSPHNKTLLAKMPAAFAPRFPGKDEGHTHFQVLVGKGTLFDRDMKLINQTQIPDGAGFTILAVQAAETVPWTKPDDIAYDPDKPLPKRSGPIKGGFFAVMADGSPWFISDKATEETIRRAITRNDGKEFDRADLDPKSK